MALALGAIASCSTTPCEDSCAELADSCGADEAACVRFCDRFGHDACGDCADCLSALCDAKRCAPECSDC